MARRKVDITLPDGRLFPNTPSGSALNIEVFGATGPFSSGKTILGLTIAPGVHPEGHPFAGQPRTLLLDFEKSAGTYGGTGCRRIDVPAKLLELQGNRYTPLETFRWFYDLIENQVKPWQFDVIMADPVTDIESGLVEYVKAHCGDFGLTSAQVSKGGGLVWGAVKDFWKQVLLKLGAKCQCFYFTSHLRQVWQGNTPTNRQEPKGKETLMELASLYLWLDRKPDDKGNVPNVPAATVLKSRLADTLIDDNGLLRVIQLLPPRIPEATIGAIRQYIANPPDYAKLREDERVRETVMSDDEKLLVKLATAEAEKEVEGARLAQLSRRTELQAQARAASAATPQFADKTAEMHVDAAKKREADARAAERHAAEDEELKRLEIKTDAAEARRTAETARLMAGHDPNGNGSNGNGAAPNGKGTAPEPEARDPNLCTRQQVAEVKRLVTLLKVPKDVFLRMLSRVNVERVSDLTREHCLLLTNKLKAKLDEQMEANEEAPFC